MDRCRWGWWFYGLLVVMILAACQSDNAPSTPTPLARPSPLPTVFMLEPDSLPTSEVAISVDPATQSPESGLPNLSDTVGQLSYLPGEQVNLLPIPPLVSIESLPSAPVNPAFEGDQQVQGAAEIVVPEGWIAWWREGVVDCRIYIEMGIGNLCPTYLSDDPVLYKRPQFALISSTQPEFSGRVLGDGQTAQFFCTYGICSGGYMQRVQVVPGETYSLSAWAQSWCADQNTGQQSQLTTQTDRLNCLLSVGIDPTGGANPLSPLIVWSNAYSYDHFSLIQTPPIVATTGAMTLYLRGRNLWGFQHNDFHFDQVEFTQVR